MNEARSFLMYWFSIRPAPTQEKSVFRLAQADDAANAVQPRVHSQAI